MLLLAVSSAPRKMPDIPSVTLLEALAFLLFLRYREDYRTIILFYKVEKAF